MDDGKLAFEVVETGARHDGRGRRLESALERERLLERYDASGLTQRAFAQREGINYHTFVAWLGRWRPLENPVSCVRHGSTVALKNMLSAAEVAFLRRGRRGR